MTDDPSRADVTEKQQTKLEVQVAILGANAIAICDCKAVTFYVVMKQDDDGNNFIVALVCPGCDHVMKVPFETSPVAGTA